MTVRDWRDVPAAALAPLYAGERDRSLQTLQWDSGGAWQEVEAARTGWGLPGLVAVDTRARVRGLAFYVVDGDRMDIGGIVSDDVQVTDALLDGLVTAADALTGSTVRLLVSDGPAALCSGLKTRGFEVEPHLYLSRCLSRRDRQKKDPRFDSWSQSDIPPVAALLRRAYEPARGAMFAAHHQPAEWERYVLNLVSHPGCGVLNRGATALLRDGGEVRAVAMMTDIAPHTAHLVQLAVDPTMRGQGTGRALVDEVCARLSAAGYRAVTLLVAAGNAPARALYDAADFRQDATFVGATRAPRPRLV
jgi:ribosomal protein S18 acetylase RimI-like enzyme